MKKHPFHIFVLTFCLFLPNINHAGGLPVFDGTNLTFNFLTAARTLDSTIKEAIMIVKLTTQITNQINQIANQVLMLKNLPQTVLNDFMGELGTQFADVVAVYDDYNGLMKEVKTAKTAFNNLYRTFDNATFQPSINFDQAMNSMLKSARKANEDSMHTLQTLQTLKSDGDALNKMITASSSADGAKGAVQAQTQGVALLNKQIMDLRQLQAALIQSQVSMNQMELDVKHQVQEVSKRFLSDMTAPPTAVKPVGTTDGPPKFH